jgi:GT2 family glycosyltransferase
MSGDEPDRAAERPELSVVVCTHNGERRLSGALSRLRRQSLNPSRYELIVVDDGSTDGSARVAEAYGAQLVRLRTNRGVAAARNAGTRAANAEIIAFTDDDCEPADDWLEALLPPFAEQTLDGISGRVIPRCENRFLLRYLRSRNPVTAFGEELLASSAWTTRVRRYLRTAAGTHQPLRPGAKLYTVVGANMALRRALIDELDGFDEAIQLGGDEEDLCCRAHARPRGAVFRYHPPAAIDHVFEPQLRDSLRRARAYGRGHPHLASTHRDVKLIVYPFPVALALAGIAVLGSGHRRWLALIALAPIAAYMRWPMHALRQRSFEPLLYPYLELAEEASTMIGELEGLRTLSRRPAANQGQSGSHDCPQ